MSNQPAVSVIIPTFNRASFVRQAIESVLQQRFQDYELIVVDDGSTDETRSVVESLGPRVLYVYQSNRGAAAARNFGVRHARAPWIAFQDSDDLCAPDHLESLYGYVRDHPDCGMVFGNGAYLDGPKHNRDTIIPAKSRAVWKRRALPCKIICQKHRAAPSLDHFEKRLRCGRRHG